MPRIYNVGNDIIKAYLGGVHARQQQINEQNKVDFENEKLKQDTDFKLKSLDQAQKEFNATHALHKALNEVAVASHRADIQRKFAETGLPQPGSTVTETNDTTPQQDFEALNTATQGMGQNQVREGTSAPSFTRNMTLDGVDYKVPDPFTFRKQQAQLQDISNQPKINLAGGVAKAQAEAKLPSQMSLLTTKEAAAIKLKEAEFAQRKQIVDSQLAGNKTVAEIRERASKYAADTNAASRISAATINANKPHGGVDPEELQDSATLNATGQAELPTGANKVHVTSILHQSGLIPIDKQTADKIKALGVLPDIFNKLDAHIDEYLSDDGIGQLGTAIKGQIPFTPMANAMQALKMDAAPIARSLEGLNGRLTNQQLNVAMETIASAKVSKSEAHKKINQLRGQVVNKVFNETLSNVPEKQRQMIIQANPTLNEFMQKYGQSSGVSDVDRLVKKHGGQ